MSVKYGLLGILARKPQHGYELKRSFEEITGGFWELNYGQIYQTLDRLEGDGLVRFSVEHEDNVPDKKVYEITEAGRHALGSWIEQPSARLRPLRDELFIRLAIMSSGELEPMLELIEAHKDIYFRKMRELTQHKNDVQDKSFSSDSLIEDLLIDAALFHAEADLRWLDHSEAKLRQHFKPAN